MSSCVATSKDTYGVRTQVIRCRPTGFRISETAPAPTSACSIRLPSENLQARCLTVAGEGRRKKARGQLSLLPSPKNLNCWKIVRKFSSKNAKIETEKTSILGIFWEGGKIDILSIHNPRCWKFAAVCQNSIVICSAFPAENRLAYFLTQDAAVGETHDASRRPNITGAGYRNHVASHSCREALGN